MIQQNSVTSFSNCGKKESEVTFQLVDRFVARSIVGSTVGLAGSLGIGAAVRALIILLFFVVPDIAVGQPSVDRAIDKTQPKLVKIWGAGGSRGLESYQSGMLISEDGIILTAWSYVLDVDPIKVVLSDGRKFEAKLKGYDPSIEIALLKIDATGLQHFKLDQSIELESGDSVLAFSNLFAVASGKEQSSVLHGIVAAKTKLDGRRGAFKSTYRGDIYVLDAMTNNPGAAGGAITDSNGKLVGIIGRELKSASSNRWLNYAMPISSLTQSVEDILAGRWKPISDANANNKADDPYDLVVLGFRLVPDVVANTPPYVDSVKPRSLGHRAGLRTDDLILFINRRVIRSCKQVTDQLSQIDRDESLSLIIRRDGEIKTITIKN